MNVKVGLIGAGNWGKNLARTLYELEALGAIAEPRPEAQSELKNLYPNIPLYSDHNELLRSGLPAVVIATPAATHYEVAKAALEAGKHTFVEKPLSLSLSQAEELVQLAKSKGLILMVGHLLLFQPAIKWIKDFLQTGKLGRIFSLHQERLKLGTVRDIENVLWSFGVHDIAVFLFLVGEKPENVVAWGQAVIQEKVEDDVYLHLRFSSGIDAHLHTSWLWPERRRRLTIVGEKGMLTYDEITGEVTLHRKFVTPKLKHIDEGSEVVFKSLEEPLKLELQHFIECVTTGKTPLSDGESALPVIWILEKATEQLKTAKKNKKYFVHESAYVDPEVEIGEGTKIWHFSHILKGSKIGKNCIIGQNVMIGPDVFIGNGCKIQNNVSIYKGVTLEDEVFCGPSCVFTNVYNPRAFIERKSEFRSTLVKRGATIGANATIICGVTIGRYAMVGAGAVVREDVPDYALVVGVPAKQIGWVCKCGTTLHFNKNNFAVCEYCGNEYKVNNNVLEIIKEK